MPERDEASMSVDHECPDCGERYNEPKSASANHVCDPELLKERIENLSEQLSDQRFLCREHGLGVAADEDGCCVTCGQDCAHVAVLVDFPDPSCVDCGCDLEGDGERCDACEAHHGGVCGEGCPVVDGEGGHLPCP